MKFMVTRNAGVIFVKAFWMKLQLYDIIKQVEFLK